jgi:hypothetical protein
LASPRNLFAARSDCIGNNQTFPPFSPTICFGHAFRSLPIAILETYGHPGAAYDEEVDPHAEFLGFHFSTRSDDAKLDIVARRDRRIVALISARWRRRHDRLDLVDEALAYAPALRRQNPTGKLYAVIGEFDPNRLAKVLCHYPPVMPTGAISATVQLAPELLWSGLRQNGRTVHLRGLEWLTHETYGWR